MSNVLKFVSSLPSPRLGCPKPPDSAYEETSGLGLPVVVCQTVHPKARLSSNVRKVFKAARCRDISRLRSRLELGGSVASV
jgi:hypothetical protein